MTKKTYNMAVGVLGGVAAIASALVTYFNPAYAAQTVAAIGIVDTAAVEVMSLFRKDEKSE